MKLQLPIGNFHYFVRCRWRFSRGPVSRFGQPASCGFGGWLGAIWRLRIWKFNRHNRESATEIQGGCVQWQISEVHPKIELVAGTPAAEAVEEAPAGVGRERSSRRSASGKRAGATPLMAVAASGLIVDKEKHAAYWYPLSNRRVVQPTHALADLPALACRF